MDDPLEPLRRDWLRHLKDRNLAANTIRLYGHAADQLSQYLAEHHPVRDPVEIARRDIEHFMGHMTETRSASTAAPGHRDHPPFARFRRSAGRGQRTPALFGQPQFRSGAVAVAVALA